MLTLTDLRRVKLSPYVSLTLSRLTLNLFCPSRTGTFGQNAIANFTGQTSIVLALIYTQMFLLLFKIGTYTLVNT